MLTRIWRNYEGVIFNTDGRVIIKKIVKTKFGRKDKRYLGEYIISYDEHDKPKRFKTLVNDLRNMRLGSESKNSTK